MEFNMYIIMLQTIVVYDIVILPLEERLAILDGELRYHSTRLKRIPVAPDVVVVDLGENTPVL